MHDSDCRTTDAWTELTQQQLQHALDLLSALNSLEQQHLQLRLQRAQQAAAAEPLPTVPLIMTHRSPDSRHTIPRAA